MQLNDFLTFHPEDEDPFKVFNALVLEVFRLSGLLLAWGNEIGQGLGLTSALWHVLGATAQGHHTCAGIARRMGLTRQSVRRTAQLLERRGLVTFLPNPEHKRAHLVHLTDQGREALQGVLNRWKEASSQAYEHFSLEELRQAFDLLGRLNARLDSNEQGDNND